MIALSWIIPLITNAFPFVGWGKYHFVPYCYGCFMLWDLTINIASFDFFVGLANFYPPAGIVIFCYIKMYQETRKIIATRPPSLETDKQVKKWKADLKAAKIFALIMGLFLFTWMPFVGCRTYKIFAGSTTLIKTLEEVTLFTLTLSNYMNPIVYCLMNREFRGKMIAIFDRRPIPID